MKAIYQKPEIELTNVEIQAVMAASGLNGDATEGNTDKPGSGDAGGAAGNEGFSVWDED